MKCLAYCKAFSTHSQAALSSAALSGLQVDRKHCAFVTFATREAAEAAADALSNRLIIQGNRCRLLWGKPMEKRDNPPLAHNAHLMPSQVGSLMHTTLSPQISAAHTVLHQSSHFVPMPEPEAVCLLRAAMVCLCALQPQPG